MTSPSTGGRNAAGVRVLLADDDALVRTALRLILGADPGVEVAGEAADGAEAVELAGRLRPDVVLMDIRMPVLDGLAATERLGALAEPPAVLVLTTFDTDDHLLRALRLGARGFLLKDAPPADIVRAVREAASGGTPLAPAAVGRLIRHAVREDPVAARAQRAREALDTLTGRERDVALAVAEGGSNAEIAAALQMSVASVKTYVSRVLAKLECGNRVQVAVLVHESRG